MSPSEHAPFRQIIFWTLVFIHILEEKNGSESIPCWHLKSQLAEKLSSITVINDQPIDVYHTSHSKQYPFRHVSLNLSAMAKIPKLTNEKENK